MLLRDNKEASMEVIYCYIRIWFYFLKRILTQIFGKTDTI